MKYSLVQSGIFLRDVLLRLRKQALDGRKLERPKVERPCTKRQA